MSRLALAFVTLLLLPAPAHAAEGFLGVLEDGRMVRFTSEQPAGLSAPRRPVGLVPGERLIAVSDGPRGPVGVGSSARLYALDPDSGRAEAIGEPFAFGLRGTRFSLAAGPGAASARLLSDVGQDLVVDLETGAALPGPGLTRADDGTRVRPAADVAADGRLFGVQLGPATFLRETAAGSSAMEAGRLSLGLTSEAPLVEPLGFQIGADGRGYVLGAGGGNIRERQSLLMVIDPATGALARGLRDTTFYFARRIAAFAALGRVAEDRTPPRVTVRVPRAVSLRTLLDRDLPLSLRSDEAAQVTVSLWLGRNPAGYARSGRDTPGAFDFNVSIALGAGEEARLRRAVGRRLRFVISVNDQKGNIRQLARSARLTR